ncbi:replicative DNA helicase [Haloimpatiens massiliensis]|uniref:replicative DNA helicase n=1 Tax=Haloimpatiens massiliensis TaxID=1658110 RepID=UPI000C858114|nr:replicative DNA helicase [Haloimpatiens massiliensis]
MNKFYNIQMESELLGAIMLKNDYILEIMVTLEPEDFYDARHKLIFSAAVKIFEENKAIEITSLCEKLGSSLVDAGGISYISSIISSALPTFNINHYAATLKEKSTNRKLKLLMTKGVKLIEKEDSCSDKVMDYMEENFFKLKNVKKQDQGDLIPALESVINTMELRYKKGGGIRGISTGYKNLDYMIGGLSYKDFILLAARPSMGKTSFALNIALNVALRKKEKVAFFNLEMSKEHVLERALSICSGISCDHIKHSTLTDKQWLDIINTTDSLSSCPLHIYDSIFMLKDIKHECKKLKLQKGLDLVIIDYLQLIDSGEKSENRSIDVGKISRSLKLLAKELDVTVIALSQLSRAPEARLNHRPLLSDLRESGNLEQDADVVMFLYRDSYYNKDSQEKNIIENIISKNRNGKVGTVKLKWQEDLQRIS